MGANLTCNGWKQLATDDQITVSSERTRVLESDRGYLNSNDITGDNLDNIVDNGKYRGNNLKSLPIGVDLSSTCVIDVTRIENLWHCRQLLTCDFGTFIRWKTNTWGSWKQIATTEKTEISYTLNGGMTFRLQANSLGEYTDTMACVHIMWDVNNADVLNPNFVMTTLPPQLRPKKQIEDVLIGTNTGIMSITVLTNGNVVRGNTTVPTKPTYIIGTIPLYIRG